MELVYKSKKSEKEILDMACVCEKTIPDFFSSALFFGDNFEVMSSLMHDYRGKIDLIYTDPPYNTAQTFLLSKKRANSISREKDGEVAYNDKMNFDGYMEFIRERAILMRELLSDKGSLYFHIDYKAGHYVKIILDEIFGEKNFKNDITRIKSNPKNFLRQAYGNEKDLILFYAKNAQNNIWNDIKIPLEKEEMEKRYSKIDKNGRRYTTIPLHAPGETKDGITGQPWRDIEVPKGRHWRTNPSEFDKLDKKGDIEWSKNGNPRIKKYAFEHKGKRIQDIWCFKDSQKPIYPTEKNIDMIKRIILQSSNPDSIVMDCFAGSGAMLKAAEEVGRRWIGIDNSKLAIEVIKSRRLKEYAYYDMTF